MDQTFEEIANECHKDRIRDEFYNQNNIDNQAIQEYAMFCCWCRAYKNSQFTEQNFKEYQKEEHKKFRFWIKKRIAELFFGYTFIFDYNTFKWSSVKNSDI